MNEVGKCLKHSGSESLSMAAAPLQRSYVQSRTRLQVISKLKKNRRRLRFRSESLFYDQAVKLFTLFQTEPAEPDQEHEQPGGKTCTA